MKKNKLLIASMFFLLAGCTSGTSLSSSSVDNSSSESNSETTSITSNQDVTTSEDSLTQEETSSSKEVSSTLDSSLPSHDGEYVEPKEGDIYLSPNGADTNLGTIDSPLYSLSVAINKVSAGQTIFMLGGTYNYDTKIELSKSGTADKPISIQAYNWEEVVLDFRMQPYGFNNSNYIGLHLKGNYWKIYGITICHAGDNGIKVEGSYNHINRCITHHNGDTGIQLGFGHNDNKDNPGDLCGYNLIENCDSYLNYDFDNHGDADGFACKMHNGKGNVFKGCRAWRNCDDAWDLYETNYSVEIIDCWAWESGNASDFVNDPFFSDPTYLANKKQGSRTPTAPKQAGNGNGIKLGGNGTGGNSKGTHVVRNCISFGNDITGSVKGFDENNHKDGNIIENCVSWDNGYNYMFEEGGIKTAMRNNISFYTGNGTQKPNRAVGECGAGAVIENNNFYDNGKQLIMDKTITADDFISIKEEDALAPREQDGSLPNNGFGRLKPTSPYYNSGMGLK